MSAVEHAERLIRLHDRIALLEARLRRHQHQAQADLERLATAGAFPVTYDRFQKYLQEHQGSGSAAHEPMTMDDLFGRAATPEEVEGNVLARSLGKRRQEVASAETRLTELTRQLHSTRKVRWALVGFWLSCPRLSELTLSGWWFACMGLQELEQDVAEREKLSTAISTLRAQVAALKEEERQREVCLLCLVT